MNTTGTQRDIQKLREAFGDDPMMSYTLQNLEERLENVSARETITEHPIMTEFIQGLHNSLKGIDHRLSSEKSDTLTDRQRDGLIDLKKVYEYFVQVFSSPSGEVERIQRSLEDIKKANSI